MTAKKQPAAKPSRWKEADWPMRLQHARIPRKFWEVQVNLHGPEFKQAYVHQTYQLVKEGRGLVIRGPKAETRTAAACEIAKAALEFTARVMYIDAPALIDVFKEKPMWDLDDSIPMETALKTRRLLVIDSLGREYRASGSGYSETNLTNLVRWRVNQLRSTVLVTHMSQHELKQVYGAYLTSMIGSGLEMVELEV